MTFGWQGFRIDHPDDWAPVAFSGTFKEGYARIESPGRQSIQIRWKRGKPGKPETILQSYLDRLEHDAKRLRQSFRSESKLEGDRLFYHWAGDGQGRGALIAGLESTFIIELTGRRGDGLLPRLRESLAGFSISDLDSHLWSLLGLCVTLPADFRLERKTFQAGKTQLSFSGRNCTLECTRWGFGEQLVERHGLGEWASVALDMPKAQIVEDGSGLRLCGGSLVQKKEALAFYQAERNQITTVKSTYRGMRGRPSWDWLT